MRVSQASDHLLLSTAQGATTFTQTPLTAACGARFTQAKAEKIIREAAAAGANVILLQVHGSCSSRCSCCCVLC